MTRAVFAGRRPAPEVSRRQSPSTAASASCCRGSMADPTQAMLTGVRHAEQAGRQFLRRYALPFTERDPPPDAL